MAHGDHFAIGRTTQTAKSRFEFYLSDLLLRREIPDFQSASYVCAHNVVAAWNKSQGVDPPSARHRSQFLPAERAPHFDHAFEPARKKLFAVGRENYRSN